MRDFLGKFFSSSVDDNLLAQLVDMGFEIELAKKALKHSNNDLDRALDFIREKTLL